MGELLKKLIVSLFVFYCINGHCVGVSVCSVSTKMPFVVDSVHFNMWNGAEYVPFIIKGCNFGVSTPGHHPGELEVSRNQYARWFQLIKEAGFNCIRLYTLHYPHFYQVLDSFNRANPQSPLFFFQGVWLDEAPVRYTNDLYFLKQSFSAEIEENIDCVHGNRTINHRFGKAFGTYTVDVSRWNIAYIIGRETYPHEVLTTNQAHPSDTVFAGMYLSLHGSATEILIAQYIDHLLSYEDSKYATQRPVSYSSWPTLDPIKHPDEQNREEDTASIDLNTITFNRSTAGYFASYHAYPYYPDFVGGDSINGLAKDSVGTNSYLGYLHQLKKHYNRVPLLIAEIGVPSSWGIAHYTSNGMNHGGFSQQQQGEVDMRLIRNALDAHCAGTISFAFMDEWFKKTWLTDRIDYDADRRILWHNVMSSEQNYGLIGFKKDLFFDNWSFSDTSVVHGVKAAADYDFFHLDLTLTQEMKNPDEIWLAFDTYDARIGEFVMPNGDTLNSGAEFALRITNASAELYATQAYDVFGIWHRTAEPQQLFHSIKTYGAPWLIERWKNNNGNDQVQYVGLLHVNHSFLPASSLDAVTISPSNIHIQIPWSLLLFTDPSTMTVLNDDRTTVPIEDTVSDGIAVSIFYHGKRIESLSRYSWQMWNNCLDVYEYKKASYNIVQQSLPQINSPAIACCDEYIFLNQDNCVISADSGLLQNDFDTDGRFFQALLLEQPLHGKVQVNLDGSFLYSVDGAFSGEDSFEYCIFDGRSLSKPAKVCLTVDNSNISSCSQFGNSVNMKISPNPASESITLFANYPIESVSIFAADGSIIDTLIVNGLENQVSILVSKLPIGMYFLKSTVNSKTQLDRISVVR